MSATATKVLNIARSQLGYAEIPVNRTKFGRWYGMDGNSWCDMFVSWVANTANARDIIGKAAYTPAHAAWFKAENRFDHNPHRGDVVFYQWPGMPRICHVGYVEKVLGGGRIQTIEGNTEPGSGGNQSNGGGVYRRVRAISLVAGFGHPKYDSESNVTPLAAGGKTPPLIIDGQWGRNTTRALQRYVHVPDDGQIGTQTRKGLQRALELPDDGTWGRVTRRKLQEALEVATDGDWGPQTVRALQKKLNDGWRVSK
jgi:hypothetical protein